MTTQQRGQSCQIDHQRDARCIWFYSKSYQVIAWLYRVGTQELERDNKLYLVAENLRLPKDLCPILEIFERVVKRSNAP